MTYTKLIERLSELQGVIAKGGITRLPDSQTVCEAVDAIKAQANQIDALAGELNDMKDWKDFMRDKMDVQLHQQWIQKIMARLADLLDEDQFAEIEAMALRAGAALQSAINALQAENESLRNGVIDLQTQLALTCSKLDALQTQDPVGFVAPHDLKTLREGYPATVVMLPGNKRTEPLYAAPKAPTHEQVEEAWRAGWAACRDAEYVGQEAEDNAWGMSETCANADWESAAPKALEPLTDEQIHDLSVAFRGGADWSEEDFETAELFARAIEAAHGITKGTP